MESLSGLCCVPRQPALPEGEETVRRQAGPARGVQHGQRLIEFEDAHRGQLGFLLDTGDHPGRRSVRRRLPSPACPGGKSGCFFRARGRGRTCLLRRATNSPDRRFALWCGLSYDTYLYGSAATPFFGPCGRNGDCADRKGKARGPAGSRAVTGDMPFLRNHAVDDSRSVLSTIITKGVRHTGLLLSSFGRLPEMRASRPAVDIRPEECDVVCPGRVYSG